MTDTDDIASLEATAGEVVRALRDHVERQRRGETRATGYAPLGEVYERLELDRWIAHGGMDQASFLAFLTAYLERAVQLHHPRYIAHQVSTPDPLGAIDGMIHGLISNPMAIYEMGPSGATIEFAIINWMLAKVGFAPQPLDRGGTTREHGAGVLTHGGSLANLTALLAARAAVAPDAWQRGTPRDLVVLVPPGSHYSIARAVSILGLGSDALRHLPADRWGVVNPEGIHETVRREIQGGRRIMAIVANACATPTGLHDPLRPIGEYCREHGIWFHADACHGASALLSPRLKPLLDGIELADSVVWDAHKMLQVSTVCAAVLLRRAGDFARAFHQQASYLAYDRADERYDSLPRAVECTKSSLGFRVFLNLAWRGEKALAGHIESRYAMAQRFHERINGRGGFNSPFKPESNIVCFRFDADDDDLEEVRDAMMREGAYHITSVEMGGRRYLRLTVSNPLTDEAVLDGLLDEVEERVGRLQAQPPR